MKPLKVLWWFFFFKTEISASCYTSECHYLGSAAVHHPDNFLGLEYITALFQDGMFSYRLSGVKQDLLSPLESCQYGTMLSKLRIRVRM